MAKEPRVPTNPAPIHISLLYVRNEDRDTNSYDIVNTYTTHINVLLYNMLNTQLVFGYVRNVCDHFGYDLKVQNVEAFQ